MMDKDEPFVYDEVDYKTPMESPQTWPMDKICRSRFQQKMSSLLNPVTPKRNFNISNAKSLLLQCLRDPKSDPHPARRFPVSCSDEGILMDGVLVTSATKKKASESLGRSAHSPIFRSQNKKNTELGSPISESVHNKESTQSQQSYSAGKGKMLADSPCTPKSANPSKLQASAEPFILTPRQASPFPLQQHPHNQQFPGANRLHQKRYPYLHHPRPLIYVYQSPPLLPLLPHDFELYTGNYNDNFPTIGSANQRPRRNNRRINPLPTTPASRDPDTTTSDPPVQTLTSTTPTANLTTSITTTAHGSSPSVVGLEPVTQISDLSSLTSGGLETATSITTRAHGSSPSVVGLEPVTQILDLSSSTSGGLETATSITTRAHGSSPSVVGLEPVTQILDLSSSTSGGLETATSITTRAHGSSPSVVGLEPVTQILDLSSSTSFGLETVTEQQPNLAPPSDGLETVTPKPELTSPAVGLQTMTINEDWSPSDDGLPTFTQDQLAFMKSHNRILPDDVFGGYKYKKRMSAFEHLEEH